MIRITESAVVHASPEDLFRLGADPKTQLKWDPETLKGVEKLTSGPLGQGARYRGNFKGFGVVDYEFGKYDPPARFTHHAVMNTRS